MFQYPRGKLVMTAPVELPIVGKVQFRNTSKETLLKFWTDACKNNGLKIRYQERVEAIEAKDGAFHVRAGGRSSTSPSAVLLAIGRRGTPRKLGVPGRGVAEGGLSADRPRAVPRPARSIVVGGGDSALEAAASIAELGDTSVILSYRGEAFQRAKQRNRQRVEEASAQGPAQGAAQFADPRDSRRTRYRLQQCRDRIEGAQRCGDRQRRRHPAERLPALDRHRGRDQVRNRMMRMRRAWPAAIAALLLRHRPVRGSARPATPAKPKDPLEPARAALRTLQFNKAIELLGAAGNGGNADAQYLLG